MEGGKERNLPRNMKRFKEGRIIYRFVGQGAFFDEVIGRRCSHFAKNER